MAKVWRTRFTVRGCGPFPIDMLRHDGCWPRTSVDSERLASTMHGSSRKTVVELVSAQESVAVHGPVAKRWESFGWEVIPETVEVLR